MIIYTAGKYTGDIDANIQAARKVAIELWEMGHVALCPHLNTAHFEVDCKCDYEDYLSGDFKLLERCDAILMLPGWKDSKGAVRERAHAEEVGLPVYVYPGIPSVDKEGVSILREAHGLVHKDRGGDYGHPFDDFSRTAKMWSAILGIGVTPEQVALCMICVKLSREVNKPKRDNRVDIAGYVETLEMVHERRRENVSSGLHG